MNITPDSNPSLPIAAARRGTGRKVLQVAGALLLMLILLGIGMSGGVILDRTVLTQFQAPAYIPTNAAPDFRLMAQAWNLIQEKYVDRSAVQDQTLTYGAISGMVDALGDTGHSRFLSPEMVKEEQNFTAGTFEGIGAEVQAKDGHTVIVAPLDGSPAQKAGLKPGDIILKVDGADVTGMPLSDVVSRVLGKAGTQVTLTIQDPTTGSIREVTLVRATITINNVTWRKLPGTDIADVRIAAFSKGAADDLKKALTEIQAQGVHAIILDLRNDPGGLLDEAVGVTSQFLASGNVLLEKDAQGKVTPVAVEPGGLATQMPMVVLVNAGTASAAEIVAGALQDAHRAPIVGETTFGTGTVLLEFPLSDGSALLLATQEWLTPSGRQIWHKGITPDQVVSLGANVLPLTPEAEAGMTAAGLQASGDAQLLKAMSLLEGK